VVKNGKILFISFAKKNILSYRKVTIRTEPIGIPNNLIASTQTCKFKKEGKVFFIIELIK
jgi:hypothetical protein